MKTPPQKIEVEWVRDHERKEWQLFVDGIFAGRVWSVGRGKWKCTNHTIGAGLPLKEAAHELLDDALEDAKASIQRDESLIEVHARNIATARRTILALKRAKRHMTARGGPFAPALLKMARSR